MFLTLKNCHFYSWILYKIDLRIYNTVTMEDILRIKRFYEEETDEFFHIIDDMKS